MLLAILFVLLAADISVLVYLLTGMIKDWNRRRQQVRVERVQRDLAETQQQLQALTLRHDTWLREQAHEARKALIIESFRAAQESGNSVHQDQRCTKHNSVWRHS